MPVRVPPPKWWAGAPNFPLPWFRTDRGARDVKNAVGGWESAPSGGRKDTIVQEPNGTHEITKVVIPPLQDEPTLAKVYSGRHFYRLLYVQVNHLLPCPFTHLTLFHLLLATLLSPWPPSHTLKDRCQGHRGFSALGVHSTICSSALSLRSCCHINYLHIWVLLHSWSVPCSLLPRYQRPASYNGTTRQGSLGKGRHLDVKKALHFTQFRAHRFESRDFCW